MSWDFPLFPYFLRKSPEKGGGYISTNNTRTEFKYYPLKYNGLKLKMKFKKHLT